MCRSPARPEFLCRTAQGISNNFKKAYSAVYEVDRPREAADKFTPKMQNLHFTDHHHASQNKYIHTCIYIYKYICVMFYFFACGLREVTAQADQLVCLCLFVCLFMLDFVCLDNQFPKPDVRRWSWILNSGRAGASRLRQPSLLNMNKCCADVSCPIHVRVGI